MRRLIACMAMIPLLAGCYWENAETYFPEIESCDTLEVSFALDVVPILSKNCFACHSNANAPDFTSGFSLEDYEDVSLYGDRIVGAINHREGFLAMPRGQEQLDTCSINTIEAWVNQGSQNN